MRENNKWLRANLFIYSSHILIQRNVFYFNVIKNELVKFKESRKKNIFCCFNITKINNFLANTTRKKK